MPSSDPPWIAVIPARYGSSRFPGKPLVPIAGVPLVVRVARQVEKVEELDAVYVATDDDRIEATCAEAGIEVRRTSPECPTGTDRVWEAVRELGECRVVNVQGDEPLVEPASIRKVMEAKAEWPDAVANGQAPVESLEEVRRSTVPKMVTSDDGRLLYASRAPVPARHKSEDGFAPPEAYRKQVCIYAFERWQLREYGERGGRTRVEGYEDIEILRFLELGIPVRMVDLPGGTAAVDVPEDVERVEALLRERQGAA